jgi:hypothetical protein
MNAVKKKSSRRPYKVVLFTIAAIILISLLYFTNINAQSITLRNTITSVDTLNDVGAHVSTILGSDNFPIISYFDITNNDLKVVKCGNTSCSAGNIITTVDTTGDVGRYSSLTLGNDGLPVISYYDGSPNGNLKVVKCGNTSCSAGNIITTVDTLNNTGLHTSITLDSDGAPIISYYDAINGDLKTVKCGTVSCSSGNTISVVDGASSVVGEYTSITLGSNGFPVISYYDYNGDLKTVKCGTVSCSSGNSIVSVDTDGDAGQYTSIKLAGDGFPVISYYDFTEGNLKVADCNNADCSNRTITLVDGCLTCDTNGDAGQYTSMIFGIDGSPIVSYYSKTTGDLKIVKCGNTACSTVIDNLKNPL